jgi:hypothetical protein
MSKKSEKLLSFTVENTWSSSAHADHGWGNGYVAVPPSHPLYRKKYSNKVKVKNPDKIKFNGNYLGLLSAWADDESDWIDDEKEESLLPIDLVINVHGGITFTESAKDMKNLPKRIPDHYWVFGFDTVHAGDDIYNWTKEKVRKETDKFKKELENIHKIIEL